MDKKKQEELNKGGKGVEYLIKKREENIQIALLDLFSVCQNIILGRTLKILIKEGSLFSFLFC